MTGPAFDLDDGRDRSWVPRAACRGHSIALFFSESVAQGGGVQTYEGARELCDGCPVRGECAEYGRYEPAGLWGGRSPRERRRHNASARRAS